LFREADESLHTEITTITLCVLFENLVRLLFKELRLRESATEGVVQEFEQAKAEITAHISQLGATKKGQAYSRIHNIVRSAHLFTTQQMFQALIQHFHLKWEGDMDGLFQTWKRARNPLVHEKSRSEQSEAEIKESMVNESRIAGAINILLLKLFGYSGWMRASAFEDTYREI
jgi:hypothetical protein